MCDRTEPLDRAQLKTQLTSPTAVLGAGLALAVVLALMPPRCTGTIRSAAARILRPGQLAAAGLRRQAVRVAGGVRCHFQTAEQLAEARRELRRLERRNRGLIAELAAARSRSPRPTGDATEDPSDRLLLARCVPARVLGLQARAFLGRRHLVDVGSDAGIEPNALVVDGPALIDRGSDADVGPGQLVLNGRHVWGKVVELQRSTSVVRTVAEPGYRDLVRLGDPSGPQGILQGNGEPLARICLVEVTEPVSVGDPVYAAAARGVLPVPLLYGKVVRLQRPIGAAHWEIWMEPAAGPNQPERVGVLRMELNPLRVAERATGRQRGGGAAGK